MKTVKQVSGLRVNVLIYQFYNGIRGMLTTHTFQHKRNAHQIMWVPYNFRWVTFEFYPIKESVLKSVC